MANLKEGLKLDPVKEKDGVWFESAFDDVDLLVARMNNPKFKKFFSKITNPYKKQIRRDLLSDEKSEQLYILALANTILLGWRNLVEGEDEVPVQYSVAKAVEYLTELPIFREIVVELAEDIEAYKEQELEEAEGNS